MNVVTREGPALQRGRRKSMRLPGRAHSLRTRGVRGGSTSKGGQDPGGPQDGRLHSPGHHPGHCILCCSSHTRGWLVWAACVGGLGWDMRVPTRRRLERDWARAQFQRAALVGATCRPSLSIGPRGYRISEVSEFSEFLDGFGKIQASLSFDGFWRFRFSNCIYFRAIVA